MINFLQMCHQIYLQLDPQRAEQAPLPWVNNLLLGGHLYILAFFLPLLFYWSVFEQHVWPRTPCHSDEEF